MRPVLLASFLALSATPGLSDVLALSGANFHPRCSHIEYDSNGMWLQTLANSEHPNCLGATYLAPVTLPDGAVITGLHATIHQVNHGVNAYPVVLKLIRYEDLGPTYSTPATITFEAVIETGNTDKGVPVTGEVVHDAGAKPLYLMLDMPWREVLERRFLRAQITYDPPGN